MYDEQEWISTGCQQCLKRILVGVEPLVDCVQSEWGARLLYRIPDAGTFTVTYADIRGKKHGCTRRETRMFQDKPEGGPRRAGERETVGIPRNIRCGAQDHDAFG